MATLNKYPYHDYNDLNLDWLIKTVKETVAEWVSYHAQWDTWQQNTNAAYQELHDYVMNYFANLDVTGELTAILYQMDADGRLYALIKPYFDAWSEDIQIQLNGVKAAVGGPLTAATKAEMTDHSKVYVYTGSESGMVSGNWYYWTGAEWASGGTYNSEALETDKTLTVSGMAADAAVAGNDIRLVKKGIDTVSMPTTLTWTLRKSINSLGVIVDSDYVALTDFVPKYEDVVIIRKAPQKDASGFALSMNVAQYNGTTFISRTGLTRPYDSVALNPACTRYAITFGRAVASETEIRQSDIDTYFDADIYTQPSNFVYAQLSTSITELSDVLEPGCYRVGLSNFAVLTDTPDDCPTNTVGILLVIRETPDHIIQLFLVPRDGCTWQRTITSATVSDWFDLQNSKFLTSVPDGDANNISWDGWYGWGSTESVTNVPSGAVAGTMLNVVRAANTKYQIAIDYTTGNIFTRNSKNSVWTDWKRLAFSSEMPSGSKRMHILYEAGSFAAGASPERVHIYLPAENGYILYMLQHFVDNTNNCNVWQIYNAYQVDDNFTYSTRKTITISGEWECAIHLDGRTDFSGGHTHGDEVMAGPATFLLDGKPIDISTLTSRTACNELRVIRNSDMYDPDDSTTEIAAHGVEYVFNSDGVTVNQSLSWKVAESLSTCYLCMFTPAKNYVDRAAANSDFEVLELPSQSGTPLVTVTKPKSTSVTMWDTDSGVSAEVSVPVYPTGLTGGDKMTIHDNSNQAYNKVYFYVCSSGTSSIGELWKSSAHYHIDYRD